MSFFIGLICAIVCIPSVEWLVQALQACSNFSCHFHSSSSIPSMELVVSVPGTDSGFLSPHSLAILQSLALCPLHPGWPSRVSTIDARLDT